MQNNQMINLAIMGIGTIGKRHLMAIDTIDNVKLCGIVDLTEDARSFCNYNKISIFFFTFTLVSLWFKLQFNE